jgi:hypothetical protein
MTSTSDIMRAANTVADDAFSDAWNDPEGRATFERITTGDRPSRHAHRPRGRRRLVLAGALAAAAGAAVAVAGLPGTPHNGASAAWAVHQNPDGTISVEITDYQDPQGLQAKLIAAGLDARVESVPDECLVDIPPEKVGFRPLFVFWSTDLDLLFRDATNPDTRMIVWDNSSTSDVSVRLDPAKQRPGDVVWFGFPQAGHPLAGNEMQIGFTASGDATPVSQCDVDKVELTPLWLDFPGPVSSPTSR